MIPTEHMLTGQAQYLRCKLSSTGEAQGREGQRRQIRLAVLNYRNVGPVEQRLELNLFGTSGNRQAIGARVTITTPQGHQTQTVGASEGADLSQGHYRLYFGQGNHQSTQTISIHWPNGQAQELGDNMADRLLTVKKGN
jgi:hypothetical protein